MAPPNMRLMGVSRIKLTCTSFFIAKCGHIDFPIFGKIARVLHYGSPMAVQIWISCLFFYILADVGHFGCPKFTFDHISGHFRSIRNLFCLEILTKCLPSAILDFQKFAFDPISGHIRSIWIFFYKMTAGAHFGCPKFTFFAICGHFDLPIFAKITWVLYSGSPMAVQIWISCVNWCHNYSVHKPWRWRRRGRFCETLRPFIHSYVP